MWNLSMTNPLVSSATNQARRFSNGSVNGTQSSLMSQDGKKKIDYCWSFNKGAKCKFGKKCKFIERYSYCDSPSHGVVNCEKLGKPFDNHEAVAAVGEENTNLNE